MERTPTSSASRPGERPGGRPSSDYLRDEESSHFWSPTPLPQPGETLPTSAGTFSYKHLRARRGRYWLGAVGLRGSECSVKFMVLQGAKRLWPFPPSFRHGLRGMGLRRSAPEIGPLRGHRDRPRAARSWRRNPCNTEFADRVRLFRRGWCDTDRQRRPDGVRGAKQHAAPARLP